MPSASLHLSLSWLQHTTATYKTPSIAFASVSSPSPRPLLAEHKMHYLPWYAQTALLYNVFDLFTHVQLQRNTKNSTLFFGMTPQLMMMHHNTTLLQMAGWVGTITNWSCFEGCNCLKSQTVHLSSNVCVCIMYSLNYTHKYSACVTMPQNIFQLQLPCPECKEQ